MIKVEGFALKKSILNVSWSCKRFLDIPPFYPYDMYDIFTEKSPPIMSFLFTMVKRHGNSTVKFQSKTMFVFYIYGVPLITGKVKFQHSHLSLFMHIVWTELWKQKPILFKHEYQWPSEYPSIKCFIFTWFWAWVSLTVWIPLYQVFYTHVI